MREKFKCKNLNKGRALRCKTKNLQNELRKAKAQAKRKYRRAVNRELKNAEPEEFDMPQTKPYTDWDVV